MHQHQKWFLYYCCESFPYGARQLVENELAYAIMLFERGNYILLTITVLVFGRITYGDR